MARTFTGTIVSTKMQKTVVVAVSRVKIHPKYGKRFRVDTKYKAHAESGDWRVGDEVTIAETRPISKDKRWTVLELIKRPEAESGEE